MATFEVERIPEFVTRENVNYLIRNGKNLLHASIENLPNYKPLLEEIGDLYAIIKWVANGEKPEPPRPKYWMVRLSTKLKFKPYEAKSNHLRLYHFRGNDTGMILVFIGHKKDQKSDLQRLEQIIREYSNS